MKHDVSEHTLKNGAKGLIINVPGSAVYNLVIRFNSGFRFGDFGKYELPHVVEHLIACGTKLLPKPNQFKIEISKNGAMRNAMTSSRVNGYVIECAAFELDRILDLFEQYLTQPLFPAEALPTELSNVSEELGRNITDHESAMSIALVSASRPKDYLPYEQRVAQLSSITRDDVLDYYARTHTAANARFYLSGDLPAKTAARVLKRLERLFGALPSGKRLEFNDIPGQMVPQTIVTKRDIKQLYYACEVYGDGLDDQQQRALRVLRVILFGGYGSRIYGEARRRGLAYHINGEASASETASSFGLSGNVSWDHAADLFELAVTQILDVRDHGVTESELKLALDLSLGTMDLTHQTARSMLNFYMGHYDTDERYLPYDEERAQLRALTVADIKRAASIVHADTNHAVSLLGQVSGEQLASVEAIFSRLWR